MDSIDRTLLQLLEADSRTPLKALAASVGLARSSVQARIRKLEEAGIIRAYTIRIDDPEPAHIEAYLWIRTGSATCATIAPVIAKIRDVLQCRSISGDRDMVLLVRCRTLEDLAILRNRIAALDGIDSVETHPVLKDWI
jgi:Lrp/AsnC family transcriptional regulator for asnA, asnC and gidA